MTEPAPTEAVEDAAQDVEHNPYEHQQKQEEEEQDFLDPSRWWLASTAIPLFAGTFGPIANGFSICALVENWRDHVPIGGAENVDSTPVRDPPFLIAVNSISLICALVANAALLLNMARRISFAIAQPITIVGWLVSSLLLIALVSVANTPVFRIEPRSEHVLTQAYYYAIIAAALYCIIACGMVITVVGAYRGHYEKEFRLTMSQRTLMLQTIGFITYLLLGALVYCKVENWKFLDAVYWANFTLLTVGIGTDNHPMTHLGRSLLFPYAIGGIVMLGLVVGSIRSLILDRGKHKLTARMTEKKREEALSNIDSEKRTIKVGFKTLSFEQKGLSEVERREQEFNIMRIVQESAENRRKWIALAFSTMAALGLWFIGAAVFRVTERKQGWTYFVSLYFSYTSLLTIGYGDFYVQSNSGKPFFVFWSLCAVPTLTLLISNMADTVVIGFRDLTIWAGSITGLLPGEAGFRETVKTTAAKFDVKNLFSKGDASTNPPPGFAATGGKDEQNKNTATEDFAMDRVTGHIEDEELHEAEEAGERGDPIERDIHFYHYLLAKELRKVMKDAESSPPKQYSYQEWAYYLKLIGQDEADPKRHRKPPVEPNRDRSKGDEGPDVAKAHGEDDDGQPYAWSWLGTRSPLMGNKSEAEWILERLAATLEEELKKMRSQNASERKQKPPVSMDDLRQRKKPKEEQSSSGESSNGEKSNGEKSGHEEECRSRSSSKDRKKEQ
ncbi:hypothetical protein H2201_006685 [Coniosporium apollinis]|uniref:Potassium channel domain-containing protein n=1 Tax=Coniosporium apollinis TaxID=61459 RepID=A0ABQ9NQ82_9PEZI|nr:hypothetical protein H2201_006685 [Coniosporium apollinis]